jgi:multimeric flavodoxin WrbA
LILGISGSGRSAGITSEIVKKILESTNEEYEYITLAGKNINGCTGCTRCAADNICKQDDDWIEIGKKMLEAEAIVFGAPNYYASINALAHVCLERMFCFRHREAFKLAGKLGVAVGIDGRKDNSVVNNFIKKIMESNKMTVIDSVHANGYSQCYTCGFGEKCAVGNVVAKHGFIDKIEEWHLPDCFSEQNDIVFEAKKTGKVLGSILRNKKDKVD